MNARRLPPVGALVGALVLSACGASGGVTTTGDAPTKTSAGASSPSPTAAQEQAAKVGSAITLKGNGEKPAKVKVTVVKVVDNAKGADEFTKPAPGKRFVSVQFTIQNVGPNAYEDSPSNGSKLIDSENQQYQASFQTSNAGPAFPSPTKVAPGKAAKGFLTYEVPTAAKIKGVQFGTDSGFGESGEWRLT